MNNETKQYNFIIIDDSKLDCFIAEKIVLNTGKSASMKSFMNAKEALSYIHSNKELQKLTTVVLVDINMPVMNGFEFIEAFEATTPIAERAHFYMSMLTSSINESDLEKSKSFTSIKKFLNKPLSKSVMEQLLEQI